ncbi:MAG: (d)CMP kinase [Gemmataceae bacterium]|nr:(d)CMP kinase [Gemmataceae bacterium]
MIITIDGPAGTGKSTAARLLAARLGFDVLDTGAMYRAVALAVLRKQASPDDETALQSLLRDLRIRVDGPRVWLNDEEVTEAIREPAVSQAASRVAAVPAVRRFLMELQRAAGRNRNIITEGRDQGTVVFPQAEVKFFLTATPAERAERRRRELATRGIFRRTEEILAEQEERDRRDSNRSMAPLIPAPDAILIDTTSRTVDEVVSLMEEHVRSWHDR